MRMLGFTLLAAATALAACAGSEPSPSDQALVYRTGSLLKQPDVVQPNLTYYGQDQFATSPDFRVGSVFRHSTPTPVPPPPEQAPQ
ncbi:hypothetical protein GCM10011611_41950 [Aliidongia dinghuensis]|uniref:Uncharacterized protein n=1 Tax=Aliidongia dinghuensis TaxID=1867774 RepID=A0A8J2YWC0_9PROT|nr:hypothetical protein [Aliidongia dinghuensis]GGF31386.1 hypothetical protein GCM10011611_41950 [Aliidongia dinghuensis]